MGALCICGPLERSAPISEDTFNACALTLSTLALLSMASLRGEPWGARRRLPRPAKALAPATYLVFPGRAVHKRGGGGQRPSTIHHPIDAMNGMEGWCSMEAKPPPPEVKFLWTAL